MMSLAPRVENTTESSRGSRLLDLQRDFQLRLAAERQRKLQSIENARRLVSAERRRSEQPVGSLLRSALGRKINSRSSRCTEGGRRSLQSQQPTVRELLQRRRAEEAATLRGRRGSVSSRSGGTPTSRDRRGSSTTFPLPSSNKCNPSLPPIGPVRSQPSASRRGINTSRQTETIASTNTRYSNARTSLSRESAKSSYEDEELDASDSATLQKPAVQSRAAAVAEAVVENVPQPRRLNKRERAEAERKAREEERRRQMEARKAKRDAMHAERKAEKARREAQLKAEREEQESGQHSYEEAMAATATDSMPLFADGAQSSFQLDPTTDPADSVASVGSRVVIDDHRHVQRLESIQSMAERSSADHAVYAPPNDAFPDAIDPSFTETTSFDSESTPHTQFVEPEDYRPLTGQRDTPEVTQPKTQKIVPDSPNIDVMASKETLKRLKIQTGVARRARADLRMAYFELSEQATRVQAYACDSARDEYDLAKQREVLAEAKSMIPRYRDKLAEAEAALHKVVENANGLEADPAYSAALAELDNETPPPPALPPTPTDHMLSPQESTVSSAASPVTAKPPRKPPSGRRRKPRVVDQSVNDVSSGTTERAEATSMEQATGVPVSNSPIASASSHENSAPHQAAAVPSAAEFGPDAEPPVAVQLVPCSICGRRFAAERLQKHEAACAKSAAARKKRKKFDAKKARVSGTDAAQFATKKKDDSRYEAAKKRKGNWKAKSEAFRAAMRAAKDPSAAPAPPSDTSHLTPCEYCGRKFNESAYERHVKRCRDQAAKPKVVPKGRKLTKYDPRAAARK